MGGRMSLPVRIRWDESMLRGLENLESVTARLVLSVTISDRNPCGGRVVWFMVMADDLTNSWKLNNR